MKKQFMTGVYLDLHFVAKLREDSQYICIPSLSGGNGTNMTFFETNPKARFFDTLEEVTSNKRQHNRRQYALEEERQLTGYYNKEY